MTPADEGLAAARAENVQSIAAAEVRAAHRIQCTDDTLVALRALGIEPTRADEIAVGARVDELMNGVPSKTVAAIIAEEFATRAAATASNDIIADTLAGTSRAIERLSTEIDEHDRADRVIAELLAKHAELAGVIDHPRVAWMQGSHVDDLKSVRTLLAAKRRGLSMRRDAFVETFNGAGRS